MGKPDPNGTERLSTGVLAGLTHHRAGRLVEAAQAYQQALRESGTDADALLLLGLLARLTGRRQAAIRLTALAVELRPLSAGFHLSLGQAYLADGNGVAAAESCRRAVELNPRLAAAWCCLGDAEAARGAYEAAQNAWKTAADLDSRSARPERSLGHLLARLGRMDEAVSAYRAGLRKAPGDATLHYAMGAALAAGAHRREAKAAYRKALRLRPNFPEALLNLGNVHYDEGAYAAAAVCCRKALALRPTYAKAWCNLGNALQMMGGAREATGCYERTLALDPTTVAARHNLGNAWMARRNYAQAEACFRETLAMDAERAEHYNSLGNALFQQRRNDEAEACYRMALEVDRDYAAVHTNLANVLMRQSSRAEMIRHYERALELDPKSAGGHYNLALAYLRQGRYAEGWPAHEWRWDFRELRLRRRHFAAPQWRGEKLNGETILLHAEQGLGDTLQFVRYAPLVAERGGRVVLEVQPRLVRLLQGLPSVSRVVGRGEPLGDFAWHCPLMSLPLAFGTTVDTIPRRVPYVRADEEEVRAARQRWTGTGLRVGIAWAGNPQYRSDEQRSMPLLALLPLAGVPGITWFSLQMGTACGQMRTVGERFPLIDASSTSRDLAETAALVATLDLVITVDTSVAHLAGAMGVPLWVVLPHLADWRWMEERVDSPWYPGARLFRQSAPGDWTGAVERMRGELESRISGRIGDEGAGAVWGGTAGDADATVPWT
ncbi:MAG TPA: tetratricopeptide repeat protein [Acidobacteriaceae bacterium]|nr:tetratricopeptide repeat protein [Acidobacteriaceae bacterium]